MSILLKVRKYKTDMQIIRKIEDSVCERTDQTEILSGIWNRAGTL